MDGKTEADATEQADRVAKARWSVIAPLMNSDPTERELEAYARAQGTSGASLRKWLYSYWDAKSIDALKPKRVNSRHMSWVAEIEARKSWEVDDQAQPMGMGDQGLSWMAAKAGDVLSEKQEQIGMGSRVAAREIGRLRRAAVEQAILRRGDGAEDDHWIDAKGRAERDWYLVQKGKPETLGLWRCVYEKAVREVALLASPGKNEVGALEKAVLDGNLAPLRQLRWTNWQIEKAIDRARTAGAKGLEPDRVTSEMVLELRKHAEVLKRRGTKTFIERAERCVNPIPF